MIDESAIQGVVQTLLQETPGCQVIVFGSWGRGEAQPGSDLDLLVIEPEVYSEYEEMIRLRKLLRSVPFSVDIVVNSRSRFDYWKDTPNTLAWRASREGRLYE
ncbi:MAG: nucleotidyltransferase domain-containing protein [Planctomycetes bacterium]|nr:nucleotidyltransferase domain-containing protein [Planctomycetota bacterium]